MKKVRDCMLIILIYLRKYFEYKFEEGISD